VLGHACCASCSNVSRILHYCLPHSRGLSGETSSTPVSRRAQSLAETPSHPAYLASYWSVRFGSQLTVTQDSQRIDTVKLMHSGRVLPPLQAQVSTPPSWRVGPYPRLCSCRFKKIRDYDAHPRQGIPLRKKNGREKTQTDRQDRHTTRSCMLNPLIESVQKAGGGASSCIYQPPQVTRP
jgi:hypothetical protein